MSSSSTATPPASLPAENGVHVFRAAVVMPPITAVFVALRFYSRLYVLRRRMALDDYVVAGTMCILIAHGVLMALATFHGMGLHVWQYTPELNADYYFWLALSSEFYTASLFGFKTALLLLYLQIFGNSKRFRWACYITMGLTWAYLTPALLTEFLGCWPPEKKWLGDQVAGHCMHDVPAKIFYGAGHFISDLVICILPLFMIWKLKFSTLVQKLGFSVILSSGFIATAVGVSRWAIATYNMVSYDRTWWAGISFTLSILEPNLGLICACIATFSPLAHMSYERNKVHDVEKGKRVTPKIKTNMEMTQNHYEHGAMGATAFPTDTGPFMYDLHGLQALEHARSQSSMIPVQQPRQAYMAESTGNYHGTAGTGYYEPEAVSPLYSEDPGTIGRYDPVQYQGSWYQLETPVYGTGNATHHYPVTNMGEPPSMEPAYLPYGAGYPSAAREASNGTAYYPEKETYTNYTWQQPAAAETQHYSNAQEVSPQAAYPTYGSTQGGNGHPAEPTPPQRVETTREAPSQRPAVGRSQEPLVWANFSYPNPRKSREDR